MKVIHTRAEIGADRVLRVAVPKDTPTGTVEVLVVLEPCPAGSDAATRRAAAQRGTGALRDIGLTVREFLDERRAAEQEREQALAE